MIKAVLFDLWNTLIYSDPEGSVRSEGGVLDFLRSSKPELSLGEYRNARKKYHYETTTGRMSRLEGNRRILLDLGVDGRNLQEFSRMLQNAFVANAKAYDGAKELLSALKHEGLLLGLVSNCGEGTRELLNDSGLDVFFDSFGLSNEVGVRKPDAKIYMEVVDELKVKPNECVFVSDEVKDDLLGAKTLGMRTIYAALGIKWLPYDLEEKGMSITPDASVSTLMGVLDVVRGWR
ncbi:MAG: HAD family hydrolase [Candidatus Altiarchaeota archaeon]